MEKSICRVIAAWAVVLAAGSAFAATISGVSGTIEQGQTMTISGSGFGGAPNVVLFDDFEGGTHGEDIMTGPGSARFGQWNAATGLTHYDNTSSVSGSLAFQADQSVNWVNYAECLLPAGTMDVFACWWMYIPSGDRIPGEGTHDSTNWKTVWLQGAGTADDDQTLPTFLSTSYVIAGNNSPYTKWISIGFQKGEWKRVWAWIKGGYSNDGQCQYWELDDPNGVIQRVDDSNVSTMYSGGQRERIRMNGYGRTTPDCHPGFDDFYVATGPNARARVEIGNAATYTSCTGLAICAPTSWSDTSITAVCNIGGLDPADDWYLFVFDASGSASAGYHVAGLCSLTVTNGSGGGEYEAGAVVGISADPPASGKLFAQWIGDTSYLGDRLSADTTVTMPSADVSVTATYAWGCELTVNSGAGGGLYLFGTVVDIQADPAPSNMRFDQWTGDASHVADVAAEATTFTVPAYHCEVTATYEPALPGDVDCSGFVGQGDLDIILDNWGDGPPGDPRADPSGDNFVGQADLDIVLDNWGSGELP